MFKEPKKQTKLIGYSDEFNLIKNFFKDKKKSNKLLFSGAKGIGKATFAYHLINYGFSLNEDCKYDDEYNIINTKNRSYNLISNNTHPNLFNVNIKDNKSAIEISQIREMNDFANKSSFNNDFKVILIDNAEYLNKNSSNSLLKILEDENPKLFFIIIHNYKKKILETIKSRCLNFKLKLCEKSKKNILDTFMNDNNFSSLNKDFFTHYSSPGDIIKFCNFCSTNKIDFTNNTIEDFLKNIINNKSLISDQYIKDNMFNFVELYLYKKFLYNKNNLKFNYLYNSIIKKIDLLKKFNLDLESFLLDFNSLLINE
tara:strand:+ start:3420 stop:4358 length:939 start_codon:yes stop_codon:yes gene_type:complete